MPKLPLYATHYQDTSNHVSYSGKVVLDALELKNYFKERVYSRLVDQETKTEFEEHLRAVATTGYGIQNLERFLAIKDKHKAWQVGEALAECLLADELAVEWPWHTDRDKKTPYASLPGADLVGFMSKENTTYLVLGEVKTSFDARVPPGVMYGKGIPQQLEELVNNIEVQNTILQWLMQRCHGQQWQEKFDQALSTFINSDGSGVVLFGLLLRDTEPNILDLQNRAISLSQVTTSQPNIFIDAWYFPIKIEEWLKAFAGDEAS